MPLHTGAALAVSLIPAAVILVYNLMENGVPGGEAFKNFISSDKLLLESSASSVSSKNISIILNSTGENSIDVLGDKIKNLTQAAEAYIKGTTTEFPNVGSDAPLATDASVTTTPSESGSSTVPSTTTTTPAVPLILSKLPTCCDKMRVLGDKLVGSCESENDNSGEPQNGVWRAPAHLMASQVETKFELNVVTASCKDGKSIGQLPLKGDAFSVDHFLSDGMLKYKNEYYRPDEYCIRGTNGDNILEVQMCNVNCSNPETPCVHKCCGYEEIYSMGMKGQRGGCLRMDPTRNESTWSPTLYDEFGGRLTSDLLALEGIKPHVIQSNPTMFRHLCPRNATTVFPYGQQVADFLAAVLRYPFSSLKFMMRKDGWLMSPDGSSPNVAISRSTRTTKYCIDGVMNYGEEEPFMNLESQTVLFLCLGSPEELELRKSKQLKSENLLESSSSNQVSVSTVAPPESSSAAAVLSTAGTTTTEQATTTSEATTTTTTSTTTTSTTTPTPTTLQTSTTSTTSAPPPPTTTLPSSTTTPSTTTTTSTVPTTTTTKLTTTTTPTSTTQPPTTTVKVTTTAKPSPTTTPTTTTTTTTKPSTTSTTTTTTTTTTPQPTTTNAPTTNAPVSTTLPTTLANTNPTTTTTEAPAPLPALPVCCSLNPDAAEDGDNGSDISHHCKATTTDNTVTSVDSAFNSSWIASPNFMFTHKITMFRLEVHPLKCQKWTKAFVHNLGKLLSPTEPVLMPDGMLKMGNDFYRPGEFCVNGVFPNIVEVLVCKTNCSDPQTPCIQKCCAPNEVYSLGVNGKKRGCVPLSQEDTPFEPTLYKNMGTKLTEDELEKMTPHLIQKYPPKFQYSCYKNVTLVFPFSNDVVQLMSPLAQINLEFRLRQDGKVIYKHPSIRDASGELIESAFSTYNFCVDGIRNFGEPQGPYKSSDNQTILFVCAVNPPNKS